MKTVLTRMAVAAAATLTALAVAATPAHAVSAAAVKAPTGQAAAVTVKGAAVSTTLTVTVPGKTGRYHSAVILQPMGERLIQVGQAASLEATFKVRVDLATKYLTAGSGNELVVEDRGTGAWGTVPLTVLRQSRVRFEAQSMTHGEEQTPGRVRVTALVRHWTPGGWKASNRSPVRWQVKSAAGWKTLGTSTTNEFGLTGRTLVVPAGLVQLRAVRLEGATVSSAVSAGQWVVVP